MKHTLRFSLAVFSFCAFSASQAQVAKSADMVRTIFSTLQTKNEKAFVALYPNAPQFSKMMRTLMEQMLNTPEMKQMMAMDEKSKNLNIDSLINTEVDKLAKPEAFAKMQEKFSTTFQKLIEKGEKKGVNWSEAKLVNFTMDSAGGTDGELEALKKVGVKAMKGVMDFQSGGQDYQLSFDKVVYLPGEGGWFGGEFPQLARKGESLEPDADGPTERGMETVDSAAVTPPAKTKTKTKTSSGSVKTKTKTKSPARKPKS